MTSLSESGRRDFVSQVISLMEEEKETLTAKGFDPTSRIEALRTHKTGADTAEIAQQEAAAAAKDATKASLEALSLAYNDASNLADLLSGLLGKDAEIVKRMRKFRK